MPARLSAPLRDDALVSPTVGTWTPRVGPGRILGAGVVLGDLVRLGRRLEVVAPEGVAGQVGTVLEGPVPVAYGDVLVEVTRNLQVEPAAAEPAAGEPGTGEGTPLRAAMSGTIYRRPAPDAPPFVEEGAEVEAHDTVALIEVMKTFTPVQVPAAGRILRWAVADGAEVEEGAVLLWWAPRGAKV